MGEQTLSTNWKIHILQLHPAHTEQSENTNLWAFFQLKPGLWSPKFLGYRKGTTSKFWRAAYTKAWCGPTPNQWDQSPCWNVILLENSCKSYNLPITIISIFSPRSWLSRHKKKVSHVESETSFSRCDGYLWDRIRKFDFIGTMIRQEIYLSIFSSHSLVSTLSNSHPTQSERETEILES